MINGLNSLLWSSNLPLDHCSLSRWHNKYPKKGTEGNPPAMISSIGNQVCHHLVGAAQFCAQRPTNIRGKTLCIYVMSECYIELTLFCLFNVLFKKRG